MTPHVDDYKRDRYAAAAAYEESFRREYVDAPARVLVTACGMAAFTTVVEMLRLEGLPRPVAYGRELYHETKELLARGLAGPAVEVDERDAAAVRALRPSALFVDALSNTPALLVPDLRALAEALPGDAVLVVDATGLSVRCQPLRLPGRVIAFESLLKHVQLGLDRANAGVIVCRPAGRAGAGRDAGAARHDRARLGGSRAARARPRGARAAAHAAGAERGRARGAAAARRPGPAAARTSCSIRGCRSRRTWSGRWRRPVPPGLQVVSGTSFGFDVTRLYVTGAGSGVREPFLRVSAGTEHRAEIARRRGGAVRRVRLSGGVISDEARAVERRLAEQLGLEPEAVREYVLELLEERLWRSGERKERPTGFRFKRGSHSGTWIRDPEGTDVLPPGVQPPPSGRGALLRLVIRSVSTARGSAFLSATMSAHPTNALLIRRHRRHGDAEAGRPPPSSNHAGTTRRFSRCRRPTRPSSGASGGTSRYWSANFAISENAGAATLPPQITVCGSSTATRITRRGRDAGTKPTNDATYLPVV